MQDVKYRCSWICRHHGEEKRNFFLLLYQYDTSPNMESVSFQRDCRIADLRTQQRRSSIHYFSSAVAWTVPTIESAFQHGRHCGRERYARWSYSFFPVYCCLCYSCGFIITTGVAGVCVTKTGLENLIRVMFFCFNFTAFLSLLPPSLLPLVLLLKFQEGRHKERDICYGWDFWHVDT